jgi:hypothetical protein
MLYIEFYLFFSWHGHIDTHVFVCRGTQRDDGRRKKQTDEKNIWNKKFLLVNNRYRHIYMFF